MKSNHPSNRNQSSHEHPRYRGSAFRVGNPESTQETFEGGKRILKWVPTETDARISDLAGWSALENGLDDDGFGFIEIPAGTRSASTVLSGLEAWEGEKAEILQFVADYEKNVYGRHKGFDTSVALDYIGVTKDRQLFITPPHNLGAKPENIRDWETRFGIDLEQVLGIDPNREALSRQFFEQIESIAPRGAK